MGRQYIIVDKKDNVATAIVDLKQATSMIIDSEAVKLLNDIDYGHKFALTDIPEGAYVVKYGEWIGRATSSIRKGDHAHVHNVEDIVDEVRKL